MHPGFSPEHPETNAWYALLDPLASRLGIGNASLERDSERIVREWNREIEADMRRLAARQDDGAWKIVVWVVLEVIWLVGLVAVIGLFSRLHW